MVNKATMERPGAVSASEAQANDTLRSDASGNGHKAVNRDTKQAPAPSNSATAMAPRGLSALHDPDINRGLATPLEVRQQYGLTGLLPPAEGPFEVEVQRAAAAVERAEGKPLLQYQTLMALRETNAAAFFALLQGDVPKYLPIVYTPTVGDACLAWGSLVPRPTGLYVGLQDAGRVQELVDHWPQDEVKIAVVTDGERILGLGDLGVHGAGITVGKSGVYGAAGVPPSWMLPVTLDCGCDTKEVVDDPLYLGTRRPRERGEPFFALVDELVAALQKRYTPNVLVHWEDVGPEHAWQLVERLSGAGVPTFDDDIQATSAVTLAALVGTERVKGVPPLDQQTFLFFGAGQANLGCAKLLGAELEARGLPSDTTRRRVYLMDSHGLVTDDRKGLTEEKARFAQPAKELPEGLDITDLEAVVRAIKPTALIGAAAHGKLFTPAVLEALTQVSPDSSARPLVFAMSNPDSKAECSYEDALKSTGGRAVFASGTQFPPAEGPDKKKLVPAQANNCLIFPGLGLGAVASGARKVTENMLLAAAHAVAGLLDERELGQECVLPGMERLREATAAVAAAVATAAVADGVASETPESSICLEAAKRAQKDSEGASAEDRKGGSRPNVGVLECIEQMMYTAK